MWPVDSDTSGFTAGKNTDYKHQIQFLPPSFPSCQRNEPTAERDER